MTESRSLRIAGAVRWLIVVGALGAAVFSWTLVARDSSTAEPTVTTPTGAAYTCPMHPQIRQNEPGSCPICHMDLVPAETSVAADGGAASAAHVSSGARRALGITTTTARRQLFVPRARAVAEIIADPARVAVVDVRFDGWVETLHVPASGARVRAGAPLATITSPTLFQAEVDLASADRLATSLGSAAGSRTASESRLAALGVPAAEITRLRAGGAPSSRITLRAPRGGTVLSVDVSAGGRVAPGTALFRIGDLDRVWVVARVPEAIAASLAVGDEARVGVAGAATAITRVGAIVSLSPTIDPATRTREVRVAVDNRDGALVPGATATLEATGPSREAVVVPASAVLIGADQSHVFVARGEDQFVPRDVTVGPEVDGMVEIRDGLEDGEGVASTAAFLLDAESRLGGGL